ncbi:MAG: 3-isopropylmalate dehydratase small subunit [Acetomicrobium sp.]|nr:3-isopropylmalate dehydratase small subunit [Acetomicrobium sp.]
MAMDAIKGVVHVFGDNIDTDQIYPGRYLELTESQDIAKHAMEGADEAFPSKVKPGDIIVAGKNFGCGSSREHAVITLLAAGVKAVIAKSFARIFYRNAINRGLCVVEIPDLDLSKIQDGLSVSVDVKEGRAAFSNGYEARFVPFSDHILEIFEAGGVIPLYKSKTEER